MEIFVYSRYAVEAMTAHDEPHIIVSINCPGDEPPHIRTNRATLGRVNLFFWDLEQAPKSDHPTLGNIPEEQLCSDEDAVKIVDLVDAHPEAEHIIVHCTAGQSRSAGVAAALHKALNGTDEAIFKNRRYTPNMRAYRRVLNEWYARHPQEEDTCKSK